MERLAETLERAVISEVPTVRVGPSPTDPQRCSLPAATFDRLGLAPGDLVIVRSAENSYLCRATRSLTDRVEADGSVQISDGARVAGRLTRLGGDRDLSPLSEIEAIVTADGSREIREIRDDGPTETLKALLAPFALINSCSVSFAGMPRTARAGIDSAKILFGRAETATIGRVADATRIRITFAEEADANGRPLLGLDRELSALVDLLTAYDNRPAKFGGLLPTKQILVTGPPGCGKSSLVRLAASQTGRRLYRVSACELDRSEPGEVEAGLRELFRRAFVQCRNAGKCIILIDDIDYLCGEKTGGAHAKRILTQLVKLSDESQTVPGSAVVATAAKVDDVDPSLRRGGRFETEIYVGPPDEESRRQILNRLVDDINLNVEISQREVLIHAVAKMTPGYVGADLKSICQKLGWKIFKDQEIHTPSDVNYWIDEFRQIISNTVPLSLKETDSIVTKPGKVGELYGVDEIKNALHSTILGPLRYPDSYARMGIARAKGILLYGPPGCAKTSLVNDLAASGEFGFLSVSAADLYSPYVGDAERFVVDLFKRARMNPPCLVFIDEIDALVGTRGDRSESTSEVQSRVLAALLAEMDGVGGGFADDGVTVIAATNRPEAVDPALLRPGRFDRHLETPPPNEEARLQILSGFVRSSDVSLSSLAADTEGFSGADLKAACTEAALLALAEDGPEATSIRKSHYERAIAAKRRPRQSGHMDENIWPVKKN